MIIVGLFIIGLFFGSFASVLITRFSGEYHWKTIKSVLRGRSQCPGCKKTLTGKNLVPLVSYLVQKGKCSYCGKKIPLFYPSIELISGGIFVLSYLFFPSSIFSEIVFRLCINWGLMILIVSDIKYYELNLPVYIILSIGIFSYYASPIFTSFQQFQAGNLLFWALIVGAVFFVSYLGIYYFANRYAKIRNIAREGGGLGFGDVLFSVLAGLLLVKDIDPPLYHNFAGIVSILIVYTVLSCIIGILYYLISLFFLSKKNAAIPFLPAMIVSLWIIILYSYEVIIFYFHEIIEFFLF